MSEPTPASEQPTYFPDEVIDQYIESHRQEFRDAIRAIMSGTDFFSVAVCEGDTSIGIRMGIYALFVLEPLSTVLTSVVRGISDSNRLVNDRMKQAAEANAQILQSLGVPKPKLQ